ncbi:MULTISPECIES: head maturation protease, ClpP-related [Bacteria]|uniref:head maturation protease, ClpP-related n=1 Tax=Bacteria TaxID=2 RepID=UPI003C7D562A
MTKSATAGAPPRPWFRVDAHAGDGDAPSTADVYIYDEIGESWWGGIAPKALVDEITALDVAEMTVHINSPGGAAWDGITIMNALRAHKAQVHVVVDGLAASAASVIAMGGDTITMNRGAQMMIHDASGGVWGNAAEVEAVATILHKLSDSIADTYAARTGGTREQWRAVMKDEAWYTAEEAVAAGLADTWDGAAEDADEVAAVAAFDLSRFRFQGRAHAPTPPLAAYKLPSSPEPGTPNRKESVVDHDDFVAGIRERLGVTDAAATPETVLAALDEALAEQPTTEAAPVAAIPEGTQLVEDNVLAQLRADAAAGREARDEQIRARRDRIIDSALREGRITAATAPNFRALLDNDEEGTTKLLSSLAKNSVPVEEIGHAAGEVSAEDALYAKYSGEIEEA